MQNQIRCLAEEAGFDKVETVNQKLYLRYIKRGPNQEMEFLKKLEKFLLNDHRWIFEVEGNHHLFKDLHSWENKS